MKHVLIAGAAAFLAIGFGVSDASAQAIVSSPPCSVGGPTPLATSSHQVQTPSGNTNLNCHGSTTLSQQVLKDVTCNTSGGSTTESTLVYTASGNANLSCQAH